MKKTAGARGIREGVERGEGGRKRGGKGKRNRQPKVHHSLKKVRCTVK